jgi:hypothetical protein
MISSLSQFYNDLAKLYHQLFQLLPILCIKQIMQKTNQRLPIESIDSIMSLVNP